VDVKFLMTVSTGSCFEKSSRKRAARSPTSFGELCRSTTDVAVTRLLRVASTRSVTVSVRVALTGVVPVSVAGAVHVVVAALAPNVPPTLDDHS
jgi:hypothetical protein